MRKIVFFTLIFLISFLSGCDDDSVSSSELGSFNITITGLPEEITAPLGVERDISFVVAVHGRDGTAESGVEVSLSIVGDNGTISPGVAITDERGLIPATHTTTVTSGLKTIRILANANGQTASASYSILGVNPPTVVTLIPETSELIVPAGSSGRIELDAVVTDESGVTVPGVKVRFQLGQFNNLPVFGSIFGNAFTDESGRVSATFRSDQGSGTVYANISIDETGFEEMQAKVPLTVRILEEEPQTFILEANPNVFTNFDADSLLVSNVSVTVKDRNNNGIPNLRVLITTDIGTISRPELTDSEGMIKVLHVLRPSVDAVEFQDDFTATISATLPELGWTERERINYSPRNIEPGNLLLTSRWRHIYADGPGLYFAYLTATLTDAGGGSIANEEIIFTTSFASSVVQSPITTDSLGRANTIFDDVGRPSVNEAGEPEAVTITAIYPPMGLESSIEIMIREQNPVTRIDLNAAARQLTANSGDSTSIRATCYLSNGAPAPQGTIVFFDAIYGHYTQAVVPVYGSAGAADTYYIAGHSVRTDTLIAYVQTETDTAYSNEQLIDLVSGPPAMLVLQANPYRISVESEEDVTITATILDDSYNPVRQGTFVTFSTSLGTIDQSAVTNINGDAEVILRTGLRTGIARVRATVDAGRGPVSREIDVVVFSGVPRTMTISAEPDILQPRGSGGRETSNIEVSLMDSFGNLLSTEHPVVIEILDSPPPPEGPTLGAGGQINEINSYEGIAHTVFNSGESMLPALIRAYTFPGEGRMDTISTHTVIQVAGGQPFAMNINVDENGYDAGGGAWEVEVAVNVWDETESPVADGVMINFELDADIGIIHPAVTGNQNRRGASEPGMAHSRFIYQSQQTFNSTVITATIQTPRGNIVEEFEFTLPLQQGELMLNVDPANWMFNEDNDQADIRVWAILRDGHGVLINNAPILFTSNRARLWWKDISNDRFVEFFPDPARKFTGVEDRQNDEPPGTATVYLRAEMEDIFLDPFSLEQQVRIEAVLEGYDDVVAQPRFVLFTRPAG